MKWYNEWWYWPYWGYPYWPRRRRPSIPRAIRELVLARDGWRCKLCSSTNDLHIHHVDGNPWNNDPDNLIVMCRHCHAKQHPAFASLISSTSPLETAFLGTRIDILQTRYEEGKEQSRSKDLERRRRFVDFLVSETGATVFEPGWKSMAQDVPLPELAEGAKNDLVFYFEKLKKMDREGAKQKAEWFVRRALNSVEGSASS